MSPRSCLLLAAVSLAGLVTGLAGCERIDCGPGTYRDGASCVADAPVACGAGTVLRDGRCELDETALADGGAPPECGTGEIRDPDGDCVPAPIDYLPCQDGPPALAGPGCGELETGEYCVTGTAVDVVTGCPLGPDSGVVLALIDPIAAITDPNAPPIAVTVPGEGGAFAIAAGGSPFYLALVIDEAPDGADVWTRSVTGVLTRTAVAGETYRTIALATSGETRAAWATALGREDDLVTGGFLVGRVLIDADDDGQLEAAPGVQIGAAGRDDLADCAAGEPCLRLFDDDPLLTGFRDVGVTTTAASGAFLLVHNGAGTLQLRFSATLEGTEYETLTVGASAGRGFHVSFVPIPSP